MDDLGSRTRFGYSRRLVENRLRSWRREKKTNEFGMAHVADRCIAVLERELGLRPTNSPVLGNWLIYN